MNTAAVSMHAGSGVQPHPFYSLAGAVVGTTLVCAFLLWAFTHASPQSVASRLVELHLVSTREAPARRIITRTVPHQMRPLRHSAVARPPMPRPVLIPESGPVKPVSPSARLDLRLPGITFAPPSVSAFVPHAFNPYSDLEKAIHTPSPLLPTQNGEAYRSVYGYTVAKSGGRCLALQTLQVGPSPSAHATVGFGVPCPGEYRPSMADELKAWAEKRAHQLHLPPG